ncbi:tetratricopeptide repeat protein [Oscillospiraceae bacterium N12]|jgi:tetratricopeptide (TPR) repeat protein|uniref:Tetratricopeptide repeat protein n=1 Tax=Jilunia laotingensis TaxID=2763675 RepID=A0A926F6S1_9BACT|nr:tetratricopeptide repeat protein [Jilunia laotingensis]MBC8592915.1 tetratricopeptide repeat protein [Jilunia laotingensis]
MIKKLYLPLLMALVVALSSCSKKMGELSSDYFTTTPQVLEAVGGKVPVTINGKFPEKYFNKKAVVEVTPVLRWNGGEAKSQPAVFQGEKVEGNDQTISYKVGGNYTMKASFDYVPEMAKSELYLVFNAKIGNKTVNIPDVKIADGVISTSELIENTLQSANPANGDDAFQRIIKEKHNANIMFLIQQANIRASELKTAKDFNKEVVEVNDAANKKISNIEVSAYASPDGGVELNTGLAENRESNTNKVINQNLKKSKIDAPVDSKYTAQDWEGFQELVSKSNIQDKDLILRVISMYQDPAQRESEIKNISAVYKELANTILPQLRRSRLTLNYEIIGKSDEEIASLASSNPKELTIEELLYAATLTNDNGKKEVIYTKATELFPNDYRAFNNLGKLAYQAGNIDKAESYLKKAASIQAAPEVNMNLGLVALAKGDKTAAEAYLGKAAGAKELGETLGNLYIAQGQYERAVNSFGDAKTNSAALAQILAKDYNKAKNTLAGIEKPDAYTDYLMAVLGARTNNTSLMMNSLKSAIAKDSSLAKKAATDLEFAKYFTNSDFMSIVK